MPDDFGGSRALPRDAGQIPIQISTEIGTHSNIVSPATIGVEPQAFMPPDGATHLVFNISADARYGENPVLDGSQGGAGYKIAQVGAGDVVVPCVGMDAVYIRAEVGQIVVDFLWEMIGGVS